MDMADLYALVKSKKVTPEEAQAHVDEHRRKQRNKRASQ